MSTGSLEQTLGRVCAELEGFISLLQREQSEISAASQTRIEELSSEKRSRLESLQSLLASVAPSSNQAQNMTNIKALADRARNAGAKAATLNRVNGQMIAMRARVVDAHLDALAIAAGRPSTYGADGSLHMMRGARHKATA